ncbi:MAG TPA: FtsX-like permease family protein [Thermoanaerobaculia bacterium]|nr:FtsX-like permease family protein [Thermoanaerobaculia bacterium]
MRFLPLVLRNLLRKRTRTLLTVGSIVLPVFLVAFMATFLRTLNLPDPARERGLYRLVTRHKVGLTTPLPFATLSRIAALPGVRAVTPIDRFGGLYRDASAGNVFPRFAVDPATFLEVFDDATIVTGSAEDWKKDRAGGLVGVALVKKYGWKIGDRVPITGTLYPVDLTFAVRAVYSLPYENSASIFFHRAYLEQAYPPFRGNVSTVWTRCADAACAERLPREVDDFFENSPAPTKTESENAFTMGFVSLLGNVRMLLASMGAIIIGVVVLIAANTMALSVRERVVEVAVLRTLGFSRGRIVGLVVSESLALSLLGGGLGLLLFVAALSRLKASLMETRLAPFAAGMKVFPEIVALAVAIALFVGVFAALVPAVRAARRPIVEGLRAI